MLHLAAAPAAKRRKKVANGSRPPPTESVELIDYATGEVAAVTTGKVVVTLNNNDLPRVINGRPGDPISKRPFARHFTRSKIVASCKKLGLYPINAEQACTHPKVRDDTKRVGKANPSEMLQAELASNLKELGKLGVNTKALAVKTKKRDEAIEEANIAGPQEYEQAYAKLVADGVTSTNIWITLGAVAFNSAEVLAAELERVRILEHGRQKTAYEAQQRFLTLQSDAKEIFFTVAKPKKKGKALNFDNLKAAEALVLVRYVYKADCRDNISKQATSKQACVEFLSGLQKDELKTLLHTPPLLEDATILEAPISMSTTSDDQAAAVSQPFHVTFGKVVADTKGLVPLAAPEWLEDSLLDDDDKRLNGKYILVNWGNDGDEPDWIVGKLSAKGEWELEGIEGNFKVSYAVEATTAVHVLRTNEYAESADEQVFIFGGHSFLIWQVDSPA